MTFLDGDDQFRQTFGDDPDMLPERPWDSNVTVARKILHEYSEQCKLDIFIHLCQLDYVGESNIDP